MAVINWLNSNSGTITGIAAIITAFAAAVLVVITGFYAWVTKKMLEENRQMRIDAQKPDIAIRLFSVANQLSHTFAHFNVENIGSGPARDIEFRDVPPIRIHPGLPLEYFPFLRYGIGYLAPGEKKTVHLGAKSQMNRNEIEHKITVTYRDSRKTKYEDSFILDFRELWSE